MNPRNLLNRVKELESRIEELEGTQSEAPVGSLSSIGSVDTGAGTTSEAFSEPVSAAVISSKAEPGLDDRHWAASLLRPYTDPTAPFPIRRLAVFYSIIAIAGVFLLDNYYKLLTDFTA